MLLNTTTTFKWDDLPLVNLPVQRGPLLLAVASTNTRLTITIATMVECPRDKIAASRKLGSAIVITQLANWKRMSHFQFMTIMDHKDIKKFRGNTL